MARLRRSMNDCIGHDLSHCFDHQLPVANIRSRYWSCRILGAGQVNSTEIFRLELDSLGTAS